MADRDKLSLEQIEGSAWGDAPADATTLIATVHRLRRQPVGSLDAEDLRVLIGQQVGLPVLVSRALDLLQNDPLVEGDYYPGDLLAAVLRVPAEHWSACPQELARLRAILPAVDLEDINDDLRADVVAFRSQA